MKEFTNERTITKPKMNEDERIMEEEWTKNRRKSNKEWTKNERIEPIIEWNQRMTKRMTDWTN